MTDGVYRKRTILYVGNFSFPYGNAAGQRVYANGKLLRELGYEVLFMGTNKDVGGRGQIASTGKEFDGFAYYNFPYPSGNLDWLKYRSAFGGLLGFLSAKNLTKSLCLVIYYGSPSLSLFDTELVRYCRAHKIKVVADCADWLFARTDNPLFDVVKWVDTTYQIAYANRRADGVIAISTYLADYYATHGLLTVTIPPLSLIECPFQESDHVVKARPVITYAGSPFRRNQQVRDCSSLKDRIDKTISLLCKARQSGCEFTFNIYGFTKEEYLQAIPSQWEYVEQLGSDIVFHGHRPNEEVTEAVANSDFTILLRDVNRGTTAGFPTKVSESISCGTPVITTKTSDLEHYVVEGKSGYFLDLTDEARAVKRLQMILALTADEVLLMKTYCRSANPFYYRKFAGILGEFVNRVIYRGTRGDSPVESTPDCICGNGHRRC